MSKLIEVKFSVHATVEYKQENFELVLAPDIYYNAKGEKIAVYQRRQVFPTILVTISGVTKTLKEINKSWQENCNENAPIWGVGKINNFSHLESGSSLMITEEFYRSSEVKDFLDFCDDFISKTFYQENKE